MSRSRSRSKSKSPSAPRRKVQSRSPPRGRSRAKSRSQSRGASGSAGRISKSRSQSRGQPARPGRSSKSPSRVSSGSKSASRSRSHSRSPSRSKKINPRSRSPSPEKARSREREPRSPSGSPSPPKERFGNEKRHPETDDPFVRFVKSWESLHPPHSFKRLGPMNRRFWEKEIEDTDLPFAPFEVSMIFGRLVKLGLIVQEVEEKREGAPKPVVVGGPTLTDKCARWLKILLNCKNGGMIDHADSNHDAFNLQSRSQLRRLVTNVANRLAFDFHKKHGAWESAMANKPDVVCTLIKDFQNEFSGCEVPPPSILFSIRQLSNSWSNMSKGAATEPIAAGTFAEQYNRMLNGEVSPKRRRKRKMDVPVESPSKLPNEDEDGEDLFVVKPSVAAPAKSKSEKEKRNVIDLKDDEEGKESDDAKRRAKRERKPSAKAADSASKKKKKEDSAADTRKTKSKESAKKKSAAASSTYAVPKIVKKVERAGGTVHLLNYADEKDGRVVIATAVVLGSGADLAGQLDLGEANQWLRLHRLEIIKGMEAQLIYGGSTAEKARSRWYVCVPGKPNNARRYDKDDSYVVKTIKELADAANDINISGQVLVCHDVVQEIYSQMA